MREAAPPARWPGAAAPGRFRAIVLADLRQRTRGPRWRVALALAALGAWACFPPVDAGYLVVAVGQHARGAYSSAWVGLALAMLTVLWSLVGFQLVRGTVQRDFETRVWQLLGASAMTRSAYLLAKWTSHVLVLGAIFATTLAVGVLAQWVRAEDRHLDLWELAKPGLVLALPMLAAVATFAIWLDLAPRLRRTAGSVVFFLAWMTLLTTGAMHVAARDKHAGAPAPGWTSDLPGIELVEASIARQALPQLAGEAVGSGFCIGCGNVRGEPRRFTWTHWELAPAALAGRALWLALAIGGVLMAAPLLDRCAARENAAPAAAARPRGPAGQLPGQLDLTDLSHDDAERA